MKRGGQVQPGADYTTVKQKAADLGVSKDKVLKWIERGELAAIDVSEKQGGRPRWRIPLAAWQAFATARSNRAAVPAPRAPKARLRDKPAYEYY